MSAKVLIIKLGYSETLDKDIRTTTSLGDVLRTTVILNFFKNDHVTWLVDEKAYPLLENNSYIRRILIFNLESVLQLQREKFDTVINLEKGPGICAFSDSINAWRRFGFRFDVNEGIAQAYDSAEKVLRWLVKKNYKRLLFILFALSFIFRYKAERKISLLGTLKLFWYFRRSY